MGSFVTQEGAEANQKLTQTCICTQQCPEQRPPAAGRPTSQRLPIRCASQHLHIPSLSGRDGLTGFLHTQLHAFLIATRVSAQTVFFMPVQGLKGFDRRVWQLTSRQKQLHSFVSSFPLLTCSCIPSRHSTRMQLIRARGRVCLSARARNPFCEFPYTRIPRRDYYCGTLHMASQECPCFTTALRSYAHACMDPAAFTSQVLTWPAGMRSGVATVRVLQSESPED